ncbi:hypothetical protein BU14_0275s0001 [Porphyra umbilicalis]|uniref:Uncharacterized protein n=1 Tax=Porphyra umbilicalis TaxID=2786 RepID=A0A1X6P1A1_PORUM|nr:hypothetical protein BU14_0275s0001 [Porphyra umbilicalis]|eukprot:OSX74642.1 hypothetical protein BU14_0275s0001 [Porphyra umbilicalis]
MTAPSAPARAPATPHTRPRPSTAKSARLRGGLDRGRRGPCPAGGLPRKSRPTRAPWPPRPRRAARPRRPPNSPPRCGWPRRPPQAGRNSPRRRRKSAPPRGRRRAGGGESGGPRPPAPTAARPSPRGCPRRSMQRPRGRWSGG